MSSFPLASVHLSACHHPCCTRAAPHAGYFWQVAIHPPLWLLCKNHKCRGLEQDPILTLQF